MTYIHLTPYAIRVSKLNDSIPLQLSNFDGKSNLETIIRGYIQLLAKPSTKNNHDRVISVEDLQDELEGFSFISSYGEYGFGSILKDIKTNKTNYVRKISDAEMVPLFVRFAFPTDKEKGVLICQGLKKFGIKSNLTQFIHEKFNKEYPGYRLHFTPFLLGQVAEKFLSQGRLTAFRLVSYTVPSDVSSQVRGGKDYSQIEGTYEVVVKPKSGDTASLIGRAKSVMTGQTKIKDLLELNDHVFDDAKIELSINGRTKTISLSDRFKINPAIDVTNDVDTDSDGHPTRNSITGLSQEYINEIKLILFGVTDVSKT